MEVFWLGYGSIGFTGAAYVFYDEWRLGFTFGVPRTLLGSVCLGLFWPILLIMVVVDWFKDRK